jgi:hypothetical protein
VHEKWSNLLLRLSKHHVMLRSPASCAAKCKSHLRIECSKHIANTIARSTRSASRTSEAPDLFMLPSALEKVPVGPCSTVGWRMTKV